MKVAIIGSRHVKNPRVVLNKIIEELPQDCTEIVSGGAEGNHIYWFKNGKWSEETPFPYEREWQQGSDNFAYCLRTGEPLVVTAEDGRRARYVLDKMYESIQNGGVWTPVGLEA